VTKRKLQQAEKVLEPEPHQGCTAGGHGDEERPAQLGSLQAGCGNNVGLVADLELEVGWRLL
jgi:hypothetical protein